MVSERMRSVAMLALVLAAFALVGCFDAGTTLPRWQLQVEGEPKVTSVELPRHLEIPDRACTYVLTTRYDVPSAARGAPLTLVLQHLYALSSLRVDGREVVAIDPEDTARYRSSGMQR